MIRLGRKKITKRLVKMSNRPLGRYACGCRKAILRSSLKPNKLPLKKTKKSLMTVAQKVQIWKSRKPSRTRISFNLNTR